MTVSPIRPKTSLVLTSWPVVINAASGFHPGAAKALVLGLGQRRKATGKPVYYFHVCKSLGISAILY